MYIDVADNFIFLVVSKYSWKKIYTSFKMQTQ